MPSTRLKMPKPMRMLPTRSLRPADVGPAGGTPEDDETQRDEDTPVAPLGTDAQAGGSSTGGEHVARSAAAEDAGTKARAEAQGRTVARTAPCAGCPGAGSHGSSAVIIAVALTLAPCGGRAARILGRALRNRAPSIPLSTAAAALIDAAPDIHRPASKTSRSTRYGTGSSTRLRKPASAVLT